jgi:Tfp pilus assembly protein PilF
MFECQICGLLSLGGTACPACGSQLRTDLSTTDAMDDHLPTDVPGLDDAAAAWYDLEGIEPPTETTSSESKSDSAATNASLPFGFQGASNVFTSRLPFGIGSFADGMPFDAQRVEVPPQQEQRVQTVAEPENNTAKFSEPAIVPMVDDVKDANAIPEPNSASLPTLPASLVVEKSQDDSLTVNEGVIVPPLQDNSEVEQLTVDAQQVAAVLVAPPPPVVDAKPAPVRLESARLVQPAPPASTTSSTMTVPQPLPVQEQPPVPDYWRIDAQIPNYEEIYDHTESVVEMQYGSFSEDVVVFDHETDSPAAVFHSPLEATPMASTAPSILLALHPAQALNVDVGGDSDLQRLVNEGFASMQRGAWSESARSFQRLAASLPTSAEVFNNYGISLLQRAIGMRDGQDLQQRSLADAQFESAILALREAAKGAPTNGDILVNLAGALIESGRSEKALGIMNVHNARTPHSAKGLNTAAVAMFNLGQLSQAAQTLERARDDPLAAQNLQKLAPSTQV